MTDLDLLTGAIAARIRALPGIERLYPTQQQPLDFPVTGSSVLTALATDTAVTARIDDDVLQVEVAIAIDGHANSAPVAAAAVAALIHDELGHAEAGPTHVTVRVASIDS